ncbi:DUF2125 domain-containing protein [Paracoccus luteus]|uniref:DUF2125 domain-containing protein n=1 Tax=Paracoccus luteus TaxID=2508543 RepID=UPI00106FEDE5|nr:DUF2125 domain-containing protein [Paracoccus luteus]
MRILLLIVILLVCVLAAAWIGGESWLARKAAQRIEADPRIDAAAVAPLRELRRVGLAFTDVAVQTPQGTASLPALDLWAAPTSPTQFHASLPAQMTLPVAGAPRQVTAQDAVLTLRVVPTSGMAVGLAALESGTVTLDGAPLAQGVQVAARMTPMGAAAPAGAAAAYDVGGTLAGLALGVLPTPAAAALADMGPLSAEGTARLFLTGPLVAGAVRQGAGPTLRGLSSDGVSLRLGDLSLRLGGHLAIAADGRPEGAVFLYTADAPALLGLAADLGLIPGPAVALANAALATAAAAEVALPAGVTPPAPAAAGEMRLPLVFRDGKMFLGPLPLGRAPVLSAG